MYVHIGKDIVINSDNIVAILDIISLMKRKDNFEEILQKFRINDKIIDVSDGSKKSLIILNKELAYITNISTSTLVKRANVEKHKKQGQK